jgi:hypothetical protein
MHPSPSTIRTASRLLIAPLLAIGLLAVPATVLASGPEGAEPSAAEAVARTRTGGWDISYPQCGGPFPRDPAFGIVGVNGGRVFSPNPCLGTGNGPSELEWAGMNAELYMNTGNPGPELSSYWPNGQTEPRACNTEATPGADTVDCAYDYGWNAAAYAYRTAVEAYISLGWSEPDATHTPVANVWWLDVETTNSWRIYHELNVAMLQGAVDYLESMDVGGVGFYSTQRQWDQITGGTTEFAEYPSWVAGARTLAQAKRACAPEVGFTGGPIVLTQYFSGGFDADYRCSDSA